MKLTTEQIDQLYAFTIKHYVEYYDLQTELVDHLANAIEQQWQENPEISFEEALNVEFKKFGVMGFTAIVDKRMIELRKKYENLIDGQLNFFWQLPWVISVVLTIGILSISVDSVMLLIMATGVAFVDGLVRFIKWLIRLFKRIRYGKKPKWLFKEILEKQVPQSFVYGTFILIYQLIRFKGEWIFSHIPEYVVSLVFASIFVYVSIYFYVVRIKIPSKTNQYLKETYPEYELSK